MVEELGIMGTPKYGGERVDHNGEGDKIFSMLDSQGFEPGCIQDKEQKTLDKGIINVEGHGSKIRSPITKVPIKQRGPAQITCCLIRHGVKTLEVRLQKADSNPVSRRTQPRRRTRPFQSH
jgi:hypothetical protein